MHATRFDTLDSLDSDQSSSGGASRYPALCAVPLPARAIRFLSSLNLQRRLCVPPEPQCSPLEADILCLPNSEILCQDKKQIACISIKIEPWTRCCSANIRKLQAHELEAVTCPIRWQLQGRSHPPQAAVSASTPQHPPTNTQVHNRESTPIQDTVTQGTANALCATM